MKKFFMAIALCLVCAFSLSAQSASQTRIPTVYVANDQNGTAEFIDGMFMFDTVANIARISMAKMVSADGDFKGEVVFYGDINEKMKTNELVFTCSAAEKGYVAQNAKAVMDYLLNEKGSIKIEIPLGGYKSLICIVLCDRF